MCVEKSLVYIYVREIEILCEGLHIKDVYCFMLSGSMWHEVCWEQKAIISWD